jgi:beclin 1
MSFIEITQSQIALPEKDNVDKRNQSPKGQPDSHDDEDSISSSLHKHLAKTEALFSILSSRSDIDHPICNECTSILISGMKSRFGGATREREAYSSFLRTAQQNASASHTNGLQSPGESQRALNSLYEQLERTENEIETLKAEIVTLEDDTHQSEVQEQFFWTSRNSVDDHLHQAYVNLSTAQQSLVHDQHQLERLQRTNVYNDTFCIGHDGSFGTINGLRLGRLPNQSVEWAEINAAWGQTLLLLATVAERLKYNFNGYRLKPQGSTSRIEKLEYPQQSPDATRSMSNRDRASHSVAANPEPKVTPLDLFSSGEMAIGRVLNHRRFDNGMVAFLDCLSQLGRYVERTSTVDIAPKPSLNKPLTARNTPSKPVLPYNIQNDKIGDYSIKLGMGFGDAESFTRACKYVLTCCKFLLAYVSNLESHHSHRTS